MTASLRPAGSTPREAVAGAIGVRPGKRARGKAGDDGRGA
jgi:hypothetical protein